MTTPGDKRCWYYRQEGTHAWRSRKGGRVCRGCGCLQSGHYGEYYTCEQYGNTVNMYTIPNHFFPTGEIKYFPKDFI